MPSPMELANQNIIERAMNAIAATRHASNWIVRSARKAIVIAVLRSIREPNGAMIEAGERERSGSAYDDHLPRDMWQAMIDAALADPHA